MNKAKKDSKIKGVFCTIGKIILILLAPIGFIVFLIKSLIAEDKHDDSKLNLLLTTIILIIELSGAYIFRHNIKTFIYDIIYIDSAPTSKEVAYVIDGTKSLGVEDTYTSKKGKKIYFNTNSEGEYEVFEKVMKGSKNNGTYTCETKYCTGNYMEDGRILISDGSVFFYNLETKEKNILLDKIKHDILIYDYLVKDNEDRYLIYTTLKYDKSYVVSDEVIIYDIKNKKEIHTINANEFKDFKIYFVNSTVKSLNKGIVVITGTVNNESRPKSYVYDYKNKKILFSCDLFVQNKSGKNYAYIDMPKNIINDSYAGVIYGPDFKTIYASDNEDGSRYMVGADKIKVVEGNDILYYQNGKLFGKDSYEEVLEIFPRGYSLIVKDGKKVLIDKFGKVIYELGDEEIAYPYTTVDYNHAKEEEIFNLVVYDKNITCNDIDKQELKDFFDPFGEEKLSDKKLIKECKKTNKELGKAIKYNIQTKEKTETNVIVW